MESLSSPLLETYLHEAIFKIKCTYNIETILDIGNYVEEDTEWYNKNFNLIYSIQDSHEKIKNINLFPNIHVYRGKRIKTFKKILGIVGNKFIICINTKKFGKTLLKELDLIKKAKKTPVIIIYGFKIPGIPNPGYDFYPGKNYVFSWEEIKDKVIKIYGENHFSYSYNRTEMGILEEIGSYIDSIFIVPM